MQHCNLDVTYNNNKAVIDRRLRPLCCHLGSYFAATGITAHSL